MPIAKLTIPSFGNGEFICPTPDYLTCERLENVASEGDPNLAFFEIHTYLSMSSLGLM